MLDISKLQSELRNYDKVRRLLRLYHLLDNQQQLQKWQRFIGGSTTSYSGRFYLLISWLCPARSMQMVREARQLPIIAYFFKRQNQFEQHFGTVQHFRTVFFNCSFLHLCGGWAYLYGISHTPLSQGAQRPKIFGTHTYAHTV